MVVTDLRHETIIIHQQRIFVSVVGYCTSEHKESHRGMNAKPLVITQTLVTCFPVSTEHYNPSWVVLFQQHWAKIIEEISERAIRPTKGKRCASAAGW